MNTQRLTRTTTLGLAVIALAAPAAANARPDFASFAPKHGVTARQTVDLRSPDARDAGRAAAASSAVDLRSPDAKDAAARTVAIRPAVVDLRSPDAKDAARAAVSPGSAKVGSPSPRAVPNPSVSNGPTPGKGDSTWHDVAIYGGAALALVLGGLALVLESRRRQSTQKSTAHVLPR